MVKLKIGICLGEVPNRDIRAVYTVITSRNVLPKSFLKVFLREAIAAYRNRNRSDEFKSSLSRRRKRIDIDQLKIIIYI